MSLRPWLILILSGLAMAIALLFPPGSGTSKKPLVTQPAQPRTSTPRDADRATSQAPGVPEESTVDLSLSESRLDARAICAPMESYGDGENGSETAENQRRSAVAQNLIASATAEHLQVAALLEDDAATQIALLTQAVAMAPWDRVLLWTAVQSCSNYRGSAGCPLRDWEEKLLAVDSQNSESWARVAVNRFSEGDRAGALDAMQMASSAAETRIFWPELIARIERGYAAGSNEPFRTRASMAFGLAKLPDYQSIVTLCREQSKQAPSWGYACLAYGELMERQGKTAISDAMALVFQQLALEGLGEQDRAAEVERKRLTRRDRARSTLGDASPEASALSDRLITSDPRYFAAYLRAVEADGERAARRALDTYADALLKRRPELACKERHRTGA